MNPLTLALTAVGVSADAFAVALGKGLGLRRLRVHHALAIAATFGLFQALMPLIGWALGTRVADWVTSVDHWIAFGLLAFVGGSMLRNALLEDDDELADDLPLGSTATAGAGEGRPAESLDLRELLLLGVATSIDALAVGLSLAFTDVSIWPTITAIGLTTFALSFIGVYLGHRVGRRYARPAEIAGGVILVGIGLSVLLEHLA